MALVLEALSSTGRGSAELEPARADMLPKLAGWYEELLAA